MHSLEDAFNIGAQKQRLCASSDFKANADMQNFALRAGAIPGVTTISPPTQTV